VVSQSTILFLKLVQIIILEIYKVVQVTAVLSTSTYKVKLKHTHKKLIDWLGQCEEVEEN
jgi:hypothetical protein